MKRFISVFLTAVLLFALASAAYASSTGKPRFYIEAPSSAKAGDTITVKVLLEGEYTAHILTLHMNYDGGCFEYVSHKRGEVLNAAGEYGMAICEKAPDKPAISVGVLYAGDEGLSATGTVFEAEFKVLKSSASKGEFKLNVAEFGYMPLTAASATPIDCSSEGATVALSGNGGGSQPTAAPTASPVIPGVTEGASATGAPNATHVPGATEDSGKVYPTKEADAASVTQPAPDASAQADESSEENTGSTEAADDNTSSASEPRELSTGAKAGIIAAGVLLAAGLGWLGVHFIKKARAAHNEAAGK